MRVMISAAGSGIAPGIIRHLQNLGHFVIGHDCQRFGYGASICDEFYVSPPADTDDYMDFLKEHLPRCDIYLPFLDEELRFFAREGVPMPVCCSNRGALHVFTSKQLQQDHMTLADLPVVPRTMDGPAIIKPDHGRGGKGIIVGYYFEPPTIADLQSKGYVIQRFIDGIEYTVDVLAGSDGEFLFAVPRVRLQAKGVSTIGRVVIDLEVIELARKVVSAFEFYGPINIQMIRDSETGELFIIEVNARLSGSCMFTVMAGWDILNDTIRLYQGLPFIPPKEVRPITVRRHYVETEA